MATKTTTTRADRILWWSQRLLLAFFVFIILGPFIYALSVSLRPSEEWFSQAVYLIPNNPTFQNWVESIDVLSQPLMNSFYIATGTAVLSMLIVIPGAYAMARLEFPYKKPIFYSIIIVMMFPYIILIIPITDLWYGLGLYNSIPGMWIAYQAFIAPFALWVLRDYFEKLPANLEEAAQIYGCSKVSAFIRVVLPLSAPAIIAVGFLAFNIGWNDFLFANMLSDGTGPRPAVVKLFISTAGGEGRLWGRLMAQTLIIGIPPTVMYMIARRHISNAFAVN